MIIFVSSQTYLKHYIFFFQPEGPSNTFTRDFLGFSIYISNSTNKTDGVLCFKDTNYTTKTIPEVFTTKCPYHGQYVIFYNERLRGVTYPKEYSTFAYNDLCEFEVYGTHHNAYIFCFIIKLKEKKIMKAIGNKGSLYIVFVSRL